MRESLTNIQIELTLNNNLVVGEGLQEAAATNISNLIVIFPSFGEFSLLVKWRILMFFAVRYIANKMLIYSNVRGKK